MAFVSLTPTNRHPLERLLAPVHPVVVDDPPYGGEATGCRIRCARRSGAPQWLYAGDWRVLVTAARTSPTGRPITVLRTRSGDTFSAVASPDGSVHVPFSLAEAYENYVMERWVSVLGQRRLPPMALSAFYLAKRVIPRRLQLAARRVLVSWQGSPPFPTWPFDASAAKLLALYARCLLEATGSERLPFRWFWPQEHRAAVVLTHDVESEAGLRNALAVADLEEARGFRSSFNIVGDWYRIDWGIVDELGERGFELGVHGIFHDRSLFSDRKEFERQLPLIKSFQERLKAEGFRSPATHRVVDWLRELPACYDCSIPMSDPYEPQPGGCCSPWPFFLGNLVELPYTMPQDHTLFTLKRETDLEVWTRQLAALKAVGGMAQCVTHPDPGYLGVATNRELYTQFLDLVLTDDHLWRALPREVAAWWRRRDDITTAGAGVSMAYVTTADGGDLVGIEYPKPLIRS